MVVAGVIVCLFVYMISRIYDVMDQRTFGRQSISTVVPLPSRLGRGLVDWTAGKNSIISPVPCRIASLIDIGMECRVIPHFSHSHDTSYVAVAGLP